MAQPFKHPSTGRYYIRRKVPAELRQALGHEYKRSLGTSDPAQAKARFAEHWAQSEAAFARARAHIAGQDVLKPGDAERLAAEWYQVEQERLWRSGTFTDMLVKESSVAVESHDGPPLEHDDYVTLRDYAERYDQEIWGDVVHSNIASILRRHAIPMPAKDAVAYSRLFAVFEDQIERLSRWALGCHEGRLEPLGNGAGSTAAPDQASTTRVGRNGVSRTLSRLFAAYSERKRLNDGDTRSTQKTLVEYGAGIDDFIELQGDPALSLLGRDMIAEYRAALAKLPSKGAGIRGLTAPQLIAKAEAEGLPTLSAQTIRNRLRALSAVLSCGVELGWMPENPVIAGGFAKAAAKAAAKRQAGASRRKHYTPDELALIFAGPASTNQQWAPPRADFGRAWYWLPLLLYYTGARREELAQLVVADVRWDVAAGWYLGILAVDEDDGGRTVKTAGSRRQIPVHPDLVGRGFIDYVQSLPSEGRVFPKLLPDPRGFYGTNFGKRWAAYLRDAIKLDSPASPSHGFRHTFKTLCREVGVPEDVHDAITGHAGAGAGRVARAYGQMPLATMARELRKFPTVDSMTAKSHLAK